MIMKRVLPLLACLLGACAARPQTPQPLSAVAEARQCPAYPLPPPDLLKPPAKIDFLHPTASPRREQAIQLDELIKWVKAQANVDPNASGSSR